ncbi:hypothetical protein AB0D45_17520 [Streptomyces sp. NPDC048352]|uniref:hypothetical protein n=1 Tax=Streptomyces sp. NPDC048352 TaxID=3154718 RepID=UPI003416B038
MITPCPVITPEDAAVPWTTPLRPSPSRRSLLVGTAGAAGAVLLTGCTGGGDAPGAGSGIPLERRMREGAVRDSERLLERYDTTAAAHPALAGRLAPLRAAVAEHTAALAFADPAAREPSSRTAPPSPAAPGAAAPAPGPPAASREAVPAQPAEALSALADAERSLSEARTIALAAAPGELARLLASVAACGAVHAYLLTSTPGAAS